MFMAFKLSTQQTHEAMKQSAQTSNLLVEMIGPLIVYGLVH